MGSGPVAGLGEIRIPDLQPGSSIMPGKVNPVICEAVCQVCTQVIGNDTAVAFGGAAGNFELNVMMPVIGRGLLSSLRLLSSAATALADKCVLGITADAGRLRRLAESSPAIVTALNPYIGYEAAAAVAHEALETGRTIADVVASRGHGAGGEITGEQLSQALDVLAMTRPPGSRRPCHGEHVERLAELLTRYLSAGPMAAGGNDVGDGAPGLQCLVRDRRGGLVADIRIEGRDDGRRGLGQPPEPACVSGDAQH